MFKWLKRVLGVAEKPNEKLEQNGQVETAVETAVSATSSTVAEPEVMDVETSGRDEAELYLAKVNEKINKLADDFAKGDINQQQFQKLYAHYQREIQAVAGLLELSDEDWREAVTDGQSYVIRRKHASKARGYAIYDNESGMPISTLGKFDMDPDLIVPMLSSYRAATQEIFGAGMKTTTIENGRYLCFVPGELTTMMAVFTAEPAQRQLNFLEELHRLFEKANRPLLENPPIAAEKLIFPHEHYLGKWKR